MQLWKGDKLLFSGDENHEKISVLIDGFFSGLHFGNINYTKEEITVEGDFDYV